MAEMRVTDMFMGPLRPTPCDGCGERLADGVKTSDGKHWHSACVPDRYEPMYFHLIPTGPAGVRP